MTNNIGNDPGLQPIAGLMTEDGLKPNDLVRNSTEQLTGDNWRIIARDKKFRIESFN